MATVLTLAEKPSAGLEAIQTAPRRISELDSLRGLAALAVLVYHYTSAYNAYFVYKNQQPLFFFDSGRLGVQLFFMISGLVIFMTLENTRRAMDFVVSRLARLFPVFWVAVAITFTVVTIASLPFMRVDLPTALGNLTMIPHVMNLKYVDAAYWTLQIELFFYLAMLGLYCTGMLKRIMWVAGGWILLAMAVTYAMAASWRIPGLEVIDTLLNLHYINLFMLGIVFYRRRKHGRFAAGDWLVGMLGLGYPFLCQSWRQGVLQCLFAGVFYLLVTNRLGLLRRGPLVFLGTISYSLYLIHQNVGYVIIRALSPMLHPNLCILLAAGGSCLLATGLTFIVEKPAMAFIKKLYKGWQAKRESLAICRSAA